MMKSIKGINPEKGALWYLKKKKKNPFAFIMSLAWHLKLTFIFLLNGEVRLFVSYFLPTLPKGLQSLWNFQEFDQA